MTMMLALLSGFHPFFYNLLTATVLRFMSDVRKADEKAEDEGRGFCNTLFIPFRPSTYMALLVGFFLMLLLKRITSSLQMERASHGRYRSLHTC